MVDGAIVDYNIKIFDLKKLSTSGSLSNVVQEVVVGTFATGSDASGSIIECMTHRRMSPVASSDFVAFDSLTEAQICAWVTGSSTWDTYIDECEVHVSASIWPTVTFGLPW